MTMSQIRAIETAILDVPTIRGHVLSMTTMHVQSIVLVTVQFEDGSVGVGEGTTIGGMTYCTESPESIQTAIERYIAPALKGRAGDNINDLIYLMDKVVQGNPIAKCAVENALWDGFARRRESALADVFGGRVQDHLPVAWTLASGDLEQDIAEAHEMVASRRHNIFKLKIGKRAVQDDIAHVGAIKAAVGDSCSIRVDVNQAWSMNEARKGLAGLQEMGVDLVEQPISAHNLDGLKDLSSRFEIAVMADEILQGPKDAMRVAAVQGADVFSIKTAQSGGLTKASQVIAIAKAAGIDIYGGTMLESGLGTAAALQVFATCHTIEWGTELFGPLLLKEEILSMPLVFRDFGVEIPTGAGNGVSLDADKVKFYARDGEKVYSILRATT